jgi:hypothetical protein
MSSAMPCLPGLDHGAGHSLLLLYDAKAPYSQNSNDFNDLVPYPFNTIYKFVLNEDMLYHSHNYLIFFLFLQAIETNGVCKRLKCNGLR